MKGTIQKAIWISALSVALVGAPSAAMAETTSATNTVVAVAAGERHTLAVRTDRSLMAWGANYSGQLGDGTVYNPETGAGQQPALLPVNVFDPSGSFGSIKQVSARGDHSLALKEDGTVWEWGGMDHNPPNWEVNSDFKPRQVPHLTDVVSIAAGANHGLAVKSDGTVYAWGATAQGQIGATTATFVTDPIPVADLGDATGLLTGAKAVAAGTDHSLVLKTDGTVWAWGSNQMGQLGNGALLDETGYSYQPAVVPTPTQVVRMTDVKAIAAGGNHSLAVKQDGTVWSWGDNWNSQLGIGPDLTTPQSLAHQVLDLNDPTGYLTGVTAVAAGAYHSLALKADGTVRGFGFGYFGQSGYYEPGTDSMKYSANRFLDPNDLTRDFDDVVAISAGGYHSVLVRVDGTVWSSGQNYSGQLGDGTMSYQRYLTKAALVNDYTAPVFVKAETDPYGYEIRLQFNESLSYQNLSATSFTLHGTTAQAAYAYIPYYGPGVKGNTLTISLDNKIAPGEVITIDWADGVVKDVFGNPVLAGNGVVVQNTVQE